MTAFFFSLVLVSACAFYLYVLRQFWREQAKLGSSRERHTLVRLDRSGAYPVSQLETPQTGPVPVIPFRKERSLSVAEGIERRAS